MYLAVYQGISIGNFHCYLFPTKKKKHFPVYTPDRYYQNKLSCAGRLIIAERLILLPTTKRTAAKATSTYLL